MGFVPHTVTKWAINDSIVIFSMLEIDLQSLMRSKFTV